MAAHSIMIVGAGMAGLATALAFARNGHEVDIVEQAAALSEVGAGLQISPNASRILIALGLGDRLAEVMTFPDDIALVSGNSLREIAHVPCGGFAANRWGAPYGVMHRAELQALLLDAVRADPRCRLHLDLHVEGAELKTLHERLGQPCPLLVIGADGVWSQVRSLVSGAKNPKFSGQVAWRFKIPASAAQAILDPANVTAFLGPETHLVAYTLEHGTAINMVAITKGKDPGPDWAKRENPTDRTGLLQAFGQWHPDVVSILKTAPQMTCWPLFEVPDGRWSNDAGIVLIGDAAHAMTPFAAQGAAMAIEDGFELAQACSGLPEAAIAQAISGYETRRRIRVGGARQRAAFNQFAYHARGPIRLARDAVLALKTPESLAADLDWLYGYRSIGS